MRTIHLQVIQDGNPGQGNPGRLIQDRLSWFLSGFSEFADECIGLMSRTDAHFLFAPDARAIQHGSPSVTHAEDLPQNVLRAALSVVRVVGA